MFRILNSEPRPPHAVTPSFILGMSGSIRKDRVFVMAIHTTPPHLTKKDFETKVEAFIDSLLAVPVARKNILKAEMVCLVSVRT
jgi:hypothetical protein